MRVVVFSLLSGLAFLATALVPPAFATTNLKVGYGRVHPITYTDKNGHAAGFAVDVMTEAAWREGVVLEWVPIEGSAALQAMLERGEVDLMSAGMVTSERQQKFFVSRPWWQIELTLLSRAELTGPVAGLALNPIYTRLAKAAYSGAVLLPENRPMDAVSDVCLGRADAALIAHGELHDVFMNRPPACRDVPLNSGDTDMVAELAVIARHADRDVAERLRKRIDEMAVDGTLIRFAGKHPPIATAGAVRLANEVREQSRARVWMIAVFLLAPIAIWVALFRRPGRKPLGTAPEIMPGRPQRFLFAAVVVLIAVGVRYLLVPVLGFRAQFLLQSFAIAAAAQYGGIGAGLMATAVSVLLSGFVFPEPLALGFFPKQPADATTLGVFVLLGVSLSYLGERFIGAKRRQLEAERDKELERRHKAQLEAIFESMAEPLFIVDGTGKVVTTNTAFRTSHEAAEPSVAEFLPRVALRHPDGEPVPFEMWPVNRALRGETIRDLELVSARRDGRQRLINYNATPVSDPEGRVVQVVVTCPDITERKRAEQAVVESRNGLEAVIDGMVEGVVLIDPDGRVVRMNRNAVALLGWEQRIPTLLESRALFELRTPAGETIPPGEWPAARALNGETVRNLEAHIRRRDTGNEFIAHFGAAPIRDKDGKIVQAVISIHDITRERQAERDLKILRGLLPTCSRCKNIRDEEGRWHQLESYITRNSQATFSHGICPDCVAALYAGMELPMPERPTAGYPLR